MGFFFVRRAWGFVIPFVDEVGDVRKVGCREVRDKGRGKDSEIILFMRLFMTAGMTVMRALRHADALVGWQVYRLEGGVLVEFRNMCSCHMKEKKKENRSSLVTLGRNVLGLYSDSFVQNVRLVGINLT